MLTPTQFRAACERGFRLGLHESVIALQLGATVDEVRSMQPAPQPLSVPVPVVYAKPMKPTRSAADVVEEERLDRLVESRYATMKRRKKKEE